MNKPKSDAERRKKADQRKRDSGLVRVSIWIPASKKKEHQAFVKSL